MVIATSAAATSLAANVRLTYGGGNIGDAAAFQRAQEELATLVGTSGEDGAAMGAAAIRSCKAPTLTEPADLPDNATTSQKKRNDHEWEQHFAAKDNWGSINPYMYNLISSKCDDRLKERLQGHKDLSDITDKQDGIRLLALIRSICHCREDDDMSTLQRANLDIQIYTAVQRANEKNTEYCDRFRHSMEVADSNGAKIGSHQQPLLYKHLEIWARENNVSITSGIEEAVKDAATFTPAVVAAAQDKARAEYRAALLIALADNTRFFGLKDDLRKAYILGEDKYPQTLADAARLLDKYEHKGKPKSKADGGGAANESLAFIQPGHAEEKKEDDEATIEVPTDPVKLAEYEAKYPRKHTAENKALWKQFNTYDKPTRKKFHHARDALREARKQGEAHSNIGGAGGDAIEGIGFAEVGDLRAASMPDDRAYVDSCASHHSTHTKRHVDNVRTAGAPLVSHCNAGTTTATKLGDLGPVSLYIQEGGIATLLSEPQLEQEGCRVEKTDGVRTLTFPSGIQLTCKADTTGVRANMPYVTVQELKALPADAFTPTTTDVNEGLSHIQTVQGNISQSGLTPRQVKKAYLAADLQAKTGHHTDDTFKRMPSADDQHALTRTA